MSAIPIKVTHGKEIHRLTVPTGTPFATIQQRASLAFGLDEAIKLTCKDGEGDLISPTLSLTLRRPRSPCCT